MAPRAKPRTGPTAALPASASRLSRHYNEPIGPPTELISLSTPDPDPNSTGTSWVEQAQDALERVERELNRITSGIGLEVEDGLGRCDVSDLRGEVSKWHENSYYREEFKKWFEMKLFGSVVNFGSRKGTTRSGVIRQVDQVEGEEGEEDGEEGEEGRPKKKRKVAKGKGTGKQKQGAASEAGDEEEGEGEGAAEGDEDAIVFDKEVEKFAKDGEEKPLAILKQWDAEFYMRRTRIPDANCLNEVRSTFCSAPSAAPATSDPEPLSNILLTITFHPISKIINRVIVTPQLQTIVCLASNTLGELRDNLTSGGNGIPQRVDPNEESENRGSNEDDDGEGGNEDEDSNAGTRDQYGAGEMDEMGTIESATRKRITGTFGERDVGAGNGRIVDEYGREIVEWKPERRVTGACFGIEGVFYPDLSGEGKIDYAKMLLEAIDNTQWSKNGKRIVERRGGRQNRGRGDPGATSEEDGAEDDDGDSDSASSAAGASPVNPRSNDISVHSTPAPPDFVNNIDPVLRDGYVAGDDISMAEGVALMNEEAQTVKEADPNKPKFVAGTPMHETKLGDIPFRVGQPYWFVHQGNYEQVWSIDSIRWRHQADPPLTSPGSNHPYPLTTYLSRQLSSKCHICDRDPGTVYLINDFSASESPGFVCQGCFDSLHPEIPTEREARRAERKAKEREERMQRKEEKKKALIRAQRKLKRKSKPKDDDPVGSDGEAEVVVPAGITLPVEEDAEEETGDEQDESDEGADKEKRQRMFMDGVKAVPTVIEK